ncbi:MAG TPA: tetratricopeptide repeat protein [Gemmatimonadaceae bacterium]|jgi:tetratricopeptide (TPR) repeat protein
MSFWDRLTGGKPKPPAENLDYLNEALALERQGDFDAALTSYRLALRQKPNNHKVLQNMAIAYSKLGQLDEAVRCYRRALAIEPKLSGAHYGLAFLLLRRGDLSDAAFHLEAFLMDPPRSQEAERWVKHAQKTLDEMKAGDSPSPSSNKMKTSEYPGILE